jgi:phage repressor protein C with HTH and peptisase S24 domain
MEDKITNIKERILQITDYKGISKEKFFENIGMSYGNFKGKSKNTPINSNALVDILTMYPDINIDWLITGNGEMLYISKEDRAKMDQERLERIQDYSSDKKIDHKVLTLEQKGIPLVNVTAIGGFGNSDFAIEQMDVKDYYVIPKFKHKQIDFMIEVEGSSMYPKYNSGDVVACRIINEKNFIQWNKTHVVGTRDQGIIIKRIKQGKDEQTLLMVSDNDQYDPFEVRREDITGVALVVGVIRLE